MSIFRTFVESWAPSSWGKRQSSLDNLDFRTDVAARVPRKRKRKRKRPREESIIEISDSSEEEEEEEEKGEEGVLSSSFAAPTLLSHKVNLKWASLGVSLWDEDDVLTFESRRWKRPCLCLSSDRVGGSEALVPFPPEVVLERVSIFDQIDSASPLPFVALDIAGVLGQLVLFPEESEQETLKKLVSELAGKSITPNIIASNADADSFLLNFKSGVPPRHPKMLPLAIKRPRQLNDDGVAFRFPWSPTARNPVVVLSSDLERLEPGQMLNDSLVDLEVSRLFQEIDGTPTQSRGSSAMVVHCFSSQFYTKLSEKDAIPTSVDELVSRWSPSLKGVNIFETDLVLVPINASLHWSVAAVLHLRNFGVNNAEPRPVILMLDSLRAQQLHCPQQISSLLRAYLRMEWQRGRQPTDLGERAKILGSLEELPLRVPKMTRVPQQENFFDCGLYALRFARELYEASMAAASGGETFNGWSWRPSMCTPSEVTQMRCQLKCQLEELRGAYWDMKFSQEGRV